MKTTATRVENVITPSALARRVGPHCDGILLDVRTPAEFKAGHIPGAQLVPLPNLDPAAFLNAHGQTVKRIYVICQSGSRAREAIEAFARAGYSDCVLLSGGMEAWSRAELETVQGPAAGGPSLQQVQIILGAVNVVGSLLSIFVNPLFAIVPLFTGCGFVVAGLTGPSGLGFLVPRVTSTGTYFAEQCSTKPKGPL